MGLLSLFACATAFVVPPLDAAATGPVWPSPPDPPQVVALGAIQPTRGRFVRPIDVACSAHHQLAIADGDARVVWLVDTERGTGFVVRPAPRAPWITPVGVAFDSAGGLLVVDAGRAAVYRARADRRDPAVPLVPEGQLQRPTAAVQRPDGTVLVVDAGAHQVVRIERDGRVSPASVGRGEPGRGFNYPVDLAFGAGGELYVADAMNASLDRLGPDGSLVVVVGGAGSGVVRPKGVAVDMVGDVHLVDGAMQHVAVYQPDGRLLGRYGGPGAGVGELALPAGICVDPDGHIFVADGLNGRVQVYRRVAP